MSTGTRPALRERIARLVDSGRFQGFIIGVILVNAAILGVETYSGLPAALLTTLAWVNNVAIGIFVVEIALRIYAHRGRFFRDPWGWFDLIIVVVALIPASAGGEVFRVLRALRILRLLSTVRSMRMVVGALITSLPGIASIGALLLMVMYIYAVITTVLFSPAAPYRDLGMSFTSLFRVLIGDGWGDVVIPVATTPGAWVLFISYSVITAIIVLNLFIAVAVEAMDRFKAGDPETAESTDDGRTDTGPGQDAAAGPGGDADADERSIADGSVGPDAGPVPQRELLAEIRALRSQLARMEARWDGRPAESRDPLPE